MGVGIAIAGITEAIAAVGSAFAGAGAFIAGGLGLEGATLGGIGAGALIGGGLEGAAIGGLGGGALNAITGKPILPGIAQGALVGGAVGGLGPAIGGLTGLGTTAGSVLAGAGAGALGGAAIPGVGTPLQGAIGGAGSGLAAGLSGALPGSSSGSSPSIVGGPGASAAGIAAPPGLGDPSFGAVTSEIGGAPTGAGGGISSTSPFGTGSGVGDVYGGAAGAVTPGTGVSSFTNPATSSLTGATAGLDGTPLASVDASGLAAFQGNVPQGTAELGASLTSPGATATPLSAPISGGDLGQGQLDQTLAAGGLSGGSPAAPPYGTDASGISVSPVGSAGPGFGKGVSATPGVNGAADTYSLAQGATSGTPSSTNSFSTLTHDIGAGNFANLPEDLSNFASKNSGLLLGAGSLGLDALKGNQPLPGETQITGIANQLSGQASQLQGYLTSGTLPPGVHTALTQAGAAAKAAIKSQYAARGMSGSSAEVQDLANVDNTLVSQGATIATTLLNQGISEANLAAGLYGQIMNSALTQDNQLSGALATLAASAARPTINVSPSGQLVQANG